MLDDLFEIVAGIYKLFFLGYDEDDITMKRKKQEACWVQLEGEHILVKFEDMKVLGELENEQCDNHISR